MNRTTTLKMKLQVNYRKVGKSDRHHCLGCDCLRFVPIKTLNGVFRFNDYRCTVLGIENSRRYAVAPTSHVCDKFTQTENRNM